MAKLFDQPWSAPDGALAENALVLEVRTFCVLVGVRAKGTGFRVSGVWFRFTQGLDLRQNG